jgi:hypothetical protein
MRRGATEFSMGYFRPFYDYLMENNGYYQIMRTAESVLREAEEKDGASADVTLVLKDPSKEDDSAALRNYDLPVVSNEVAALYNVKDVPVAPTIFIHKHGRPREIGNTDPRRELLAYPVIFPNSEKGWHPGMKQNPRPPIPGKGPRKRVDVTMGQYYRYALNLLCFALYSTASFEQMPNYAPKPPGGRISSWQSNPTVDHRSPPARGGKRPAVPPRFFAPRVDGRGARRYQPFPAANRRAPWPPSGKIIHPTCVLSRIAGADAQVSPANDSSVLRELQTF